MLYADEIPIKRVDHESIKNLSRHDGVDKQRWRWWHLTEEWMMVHPRSFGGAILCYKPECLIRE